MKQFLRSSLFLMVILCACSPSNSQVNPTPDPNQDWRLPAQNGYGCLVIAGSHTGMQYDPFTGSWFPISNPRWMASVLGDLYLEGNRYRSEGTGASGTYRYDPNTETFAFESGQLAAYQADFLYSLRDGDIYYNLNIHIPIPDSDEVQTQFCSQHQPAPPGAEIIVSPYEGHIITGEGFMDQQLFSFNLHNGERVALGEGFQPSLGANGDLIYVTGLPAQEQFVIRSPNGSSSTVKIPFYHSGGYVPPAFSDHFDPSLSADGNLIAFAARPVDVSQGLFAVPDPSYHVYVMTRNAEILADLRGYAQPSWTADNRLVMSGGLAVSPAFEGEIGIFITDSSFTQITRLDDNLFEPTNPSVSPDTEQIAFVSGNVLWRIDMNGAVLGKITDAEEILHSPVFSPDGSALAFGYGDNLVVYPLDGNDPILLRTPARSLLYGVNDRLSWQP